MALLYPDVWSLRDCASSRTSHPPTSSFSGHAPPKLQRIHLHCSLSQRSAAVAHNSPSSADSFESSGSLQEFRIDGTAAQASRTDSNDGVNGSDERGSNGSIVSEHADSELSGIDDSGSCSSIADVCDMDDTSERERKRRERISIANKGKIPWNKGKSHSPATISLMRERNKVVMQNPRIKEKLRKYSHPQSPETREKLRLIMRSRMEYERKQLTLIQEWKDAIAEIARTGNVGDGELQWDSYTTLKKELRKQHTSSKRKKKEDVHRSLPLEHRLKISASVRAKWEDPEFRKRVTESMQEKKSKSTSRKNHKAKISDVEFDKLLEVLTRTPAYDDKRGSPESKIGSYSDPSFKEKLAKLLHVRNFKAGEKVSDTEISDDPPESEILNMERKIKLEALQQAQSEAAERARMLLAEAELAARELEAVGARDETLDRSLLEARTLLDEANKTLSNTQSLFECMLQQHGHNSFFAWVSFQNGGLDMKFEHPLKGGYGETFGYI